jgi:hypothetical protein
LIFSGCTAKEKIDISASSNVNTFSEINVSELELMMEEKQDFVLLISSESCSGCTDFIPILKEIISDEQITVYKIEKGADYSPQNDVLPYEFTPTFVVFSGGEVASKIDAFNNPDEFFSQSAFLEYLEQYVVLD